MQAKYYIELSNEFFIYKLLQEHNWLLNDHGISNIPIPVTSEATFNQQMENATLPDDKLYNVNYNLIWA